MQIKIAKLKTALLICTNTFIMFVIAITLLFACLFLEECKDQEELELLRKEKHERELHK